MAKRILGMFVVAAALLSLGACTIEGPKMKIKPPVHVDVEVEGGGGGGGYHCPPGQAKKGRC